MRPSGPTGPVATLRKLYQLVYVIAGLPASRYTCRGDRWRGWQTDSTRMALGDRLEFTGVPLRSTSRDAPLGLISSRSSRAKLAKEEQDIGQRFASSSSSAASSMTNRFM